MKLYATRQAAKEAASKMQGRYKVVRGVRWDGKGYTEGYELIRLPPPKLPGTEEQWNNALEELEETLTGDQNDYFKCS